jgi:hypothetical protein
MKRYIAVTGISDDDFPEYTNSIYENLLIRLLCGYLDNVNYVEVRL